VVGDVPPGLAPVANGGVDARVLAASNPEVGDHRLSGGIEREALRNGQPAPRLPIVLAKREEGDVRLQEVERELVLLMQLDLELHRIGLQIDQTAGLVMLRSRLRPAM